MASVSAPASESRPLSVPAPASVSASGSASPSPESPPSLGEGDVGEEAAAAAVDEGRDGGDVDEGSWLCVPRGGAPACRLVSQVALEAARFGEGYSQFQHARELPASLSSASGRAGGDSRGGQGILAV